MNHGWRLYARLGDVDFLLNYYMHQCNGKWVVVRELVMVLLDRDGSIRSHRQTN